MGANKTNTMARREHIGMNQIGRARERTGTKKETTIGRAHTNVISNAHNFVPFNRCCCYYCYTTTKIMYWLSERGAHNIKRKSESIRWSMRLVLTLAICKRNVYNSARSTRIRRAWAMSEVKLRFSILRIDTDAPKCKIAMNLDLHFLKCCLCELLMAAAMAACIECSTNKNMEHAHKISSELVLGCLFFGATKGKIETCDFDRHRICNDYMLHFGSCLLCAPFLLWLLLLLLQLQLQLYIYVYIFRSIWFDSKPYAFCVLCALCSALTAHNALYLKWVNFNILFDVPCTRWAKQFIYLFQSTYIDSAFSILSPILPI